MPDFRNDKVAAPLKRPCMLHTLKESMEDGKNFRNDKVAAPLKHEDNTPEHTRVCVFPQR